MRVISPITITDSYFSSSNVTESYPAWSAAGNYEEEDIVVYNATNVHRLYVRILAGTTATPPNQDLDNWVDYGPTNAWAMLDLENSTPTVMANLINLALLVSAGTISVALFGLVCSSVVLRIVSNVTGVASTVKTHSVVGTDAKPAQIFENGMTVPANSRLEIVINGTVAKCGACVIGEAIYLGATQPGPKIQLLSFSTKETDKFGVTTLVKGANSKRLSVQVETSNEDVPEVLETLLALDGLAAAWQATDLAKYAFLNGYGFTRDVSVDVMYEDTSLLSLEVEYLA